MTAAGKRGASGAGGRARRFVAAATVFAVAAFSGPARSDIPVYDSPPRIVRSLEGKWKVASGDDARFARPDYRDASWRVETVPHKGALKEFSASNVVWYRRRFKPAGGERLHYLRIRRVLGRAEVWVNGRKLRNPQLVKPLTEGQFGTYGNAWETGWRDAFDLSGALDSDSVNLIAVRVERAPKNAPRPAGACSSDVCLGRAGLTGNVELIGLPTAYIASLNRQATPLSYDPMKVRHSFDVFAAQRAKLDSIDAQIRLSVFQPDGKKAFSKTEDIRLTQSGDIKRFVWDMTPRFGTHKAVVELLVKGKALDRQESFFQAQIANVRNGKLFLNGEPFLVKAVNGTPGLRMRKNEGETRREWIFEDLKRLRGLGVSVVRVRTPSLETAEAAFRNGLLLIPVLDLNDMEAAVYALAEQPAVLMWEIDGLNDGNVGLYRNKLELLDPYRRPLLIEGGVSEGKSLKSEVVAAPAVGAEDNGLPSCLPEGRAAARSHPAAAFDWGDRLSSGQAGPTLDAWLAAGWNDCIIGAGMTGAGFTGLFDEAGDGKGFFLREAAGLEWNEDRMAAVKGIFQDAGVYWKRGASGQIALRIKNMSPFTMKNARATLLAGGKSAGSREIGDLGGRKESTVVFSGSGQAGVIRLSYTTHGGLNRVLDFQKEAPQKNVGVIFFDSPEEVLNARGETEFKVTAANYFKGTSKYKIAFSSDKKLALDPPQATFELAEGERKTIRLRVRKSGELAGGTATVKALFQLREGAGASFVAEATAREKKK